MAEIAPYVFPGFIGLLSALIIAAFSFFVGTVTGKNRAEVRKINADARGEETKGELTAYELAQKVMVDLEIERQERRKLERRIEILEDENKQKDKKILALEIENAELKRRLDRGKGLATR